MTKSMLCLWHIKNNVKARARPLITEQISSSTEIINDLRAKAEERWNIMLKRWNRIVFADIIEAKDHVWSRFKEHYSDTLFKDFLEYLDSE